MSCCGKGRQTVAGTSAQIRAARPSHTRIHVVFEYTGPTSLTVTSPVSGRAYHFTAPGARLDIDPRDRHLLAAIPHLRALA